MILLCTYIWMQISSCETTHRPHPRQYREFDESSKLVSHLVVRNWRDSIRRTHTPSVKIHGWRDFKIKSRMQCRFELWIWHRTRVRTFGCRSFPGNQLTGPIPYSIGNLTNLLFLWAPCGVRYCRDSYQKDTHPLVKILGWRDLKVKSWMQRRLEFVNFEFDTEPNSCTYIWMQRSFYQPTHGSHLKHREFDESANLVSRLWW